MHVQAPHSVERPRAPRGYALLTALVVSALIVSMTTAIAQLTVRQLQTQVFATNSHVAYHAAVAGYECAYYWDSEPAAIFDQALGIFYPNGGIQTISCFSGNNTAIIDKSGPPISVNPEVYEFSFALEVGDEGCVEVTVRKIEEPGQTYVAIDDVKQPPTQLQYYLTSITADGYNSRLRNGECVKDDEFIVQRSIVTREY